MGFSMFSKPLGRGAAGAYAGIAAVGMGAGAALAGEDHRTAGAVVGSSAGIGIAAYHAYGHNFTANNLGKAKAWSRWAATAPGVAGPGGRAMAAGSVVSDVASMMTANPNVSGELAGDIGRGVQGIRSGVNNMMKMFRR